MKWKELTKESLGAFARFIVYIAVFIFIPLAALFTLTNIDRYQLLTSENRLSILVIGLSLYTFFLRFFVSYITNKGWSFSFSNLAWLIAYTVYVGSQLLKYKTYVPAISDVDFSTIQQFAYIFLVIVPSSAMGSLFITATERDHNQDMQKSIRDLQSSVAKIDAKLNQLLLDKSDQPVSTQRLSGVQIKQPPQTSKSQSKRGKQSKRGH